jgi:hypothetical protein
MKTVAPLLLALAACGGAPLLANAPHPNNGAVAGVAAAAAAAVTLASPGSANQKPEQKIDENTRPQTVTESVPSAVFDRLDAQGSAAAPPPAAASPARTSPPVKLPSPKEAVDRDDPPDQP